MDRALAGLVPLGLSETGQAHPFLAYGTDWLAYGHVVIALLHRAVARSGPEFVGSERRTRRLCRCHSVDADLRPASGDSVSLAADRLFLRYFWRHPSACLPQAGRTAGQIEPLGSARLKYRPAL